MSRFQGTVGITLLVVASTLAPVVTSIAAQPAPGEGLVVFTRESGAKGAAIRFNIEQDGRPVGQLPPGSTLEVPVKPGSTSFTVRAPSLDGMDYLTLDVKAGWTYYVEGEVLWGWPTGRPKFRNVSEVPGPEGPTGTSRPTAAGSPALAGAALGSVPPRASATGNRRAADELGRIALRNFIGDWKLDVWSLAKDGEKLAGSGRANGVGADGSTATITISEFHADAFPDATGGGEILMAHEPGKGFTLQTDFRYSGETLRFSGNYQAETGRYVFYLLTGSAGKTATGMPRSSVTVEIRSLDIRTWVADTYANVDGQSLHVQSYRFARP